MKLGLNIKRLLKVLEDLKCLQWTNLRKRILRSMPNKVECKKCNHPCHCKDTLHADEYGICTCDKCKCTKKISEKEFWKIISKRKDK